MLGRGAHSIKQTQLENSVEYQSAKYCRIASAIARLDGSEYDIAEALGVSALTLRMWRDAHRDFALALKPPMEINDGLVLRAVIKHALGSEYRSDKILKTRQGPVVRSEEVHLPPNVEVAHFLLKPRMPTVYGVNAKTNADPFAAALDRVERELAAEREKLDGGPPQTPSTPGVEQKELKLDEQTCRIARIMAHLGRKMPTSPRR